MKKTVLVLLCAVLCAALFLSPARAESGAPEGMPPGGGEEAVILAGGTGISRGELKRILRLELFLGALNSAGYGYALDIVDPLVVEDKADKVIFALEDGIVVRRLAQERGVSLDEEDLEEARGRAKAEWDRYRGIVWSENGMAYLPAGDYTPADDPEETVDRYLASFGLTQEVLFERACGTVLEEKLMAAFTEGMEGTEDDLLMAYVDWQLAALDETEIRVDTEAVTRLLETLWED